MVNAQKLEARFFGAQIIGRAKIISRDAAEEFNAGLKAYGWDKMAQELGLKEFPKIVELVKVEAEKI